MRQFFRDFFVQQVLRALRTPEGHALLADATVRNAQFTPEALRCLSWPEPVPYPDVPVKLPSADRALERRPIFVTGRFRSGSTLLWQIFRAVPECTAFYEPLNERRWFDRERRGDWVDATHRGADDYWREYDGLADLGQYFQDDWGFARLFLDASAWEPNLRRYIQALIDKAPQRPVLQFNRVDFRLPWLRANFPDATYIHLYRHPRDQWCSSLRNNEICPPDAALTDASEDGGFYLRPWVDDLKSHFPILVDRRLTHLYQRFYLLWRLSYSFGKTYCDLSLKYEDLVQNPTAALQQLFSAVGLPESRIKTAAACVQGGTNSRWADYAPPAWFAEKEGVCDELLDEFFTRLRRACE